MNGYGWISQICLWLGFLLPFAVSRGVGMPLNQHPFIVAISMVLWALGLYTGYRAHVRRANIPNSTPLWIRVSRYVTASPATIIMLAIVFGFLYYPTVEKSFLARWMNYWLIITLFVMGVLITPADWKGIFKHPKIISVAVLLRWICMPLIAFFLAHAIILRFISGPVATTLAVGMVIIGTTPTGSASNMLTLISGGDLALSVSVTTANTMLAPFLQPLLIEFFVGHATHVHAYAIFKDLIEVILIPVVFGTIVGSQLPDLVKRLKPLLGAISVVCLGLMMVGTISKGTAVLLTHLWVLPVLAVACIIQGLAGLSIGFYLPKFFGFNYKQRVASCYEVGVENAALTVYVALTHFSPLAAIPGVLYGKLQNMLAITVFAPKFQKATSAEEQAAAIQPAKVLARASG